MTKETLPQLQDKTKAVLAWTAAAAISLACLGGCSAGGAGGAGSAGPSDLGPASDLAAGDAEGSIDLIRGADLNGTVIDFDAEGFTLRPTEGDDETAKIPLQDVGTDRRVDFASNVQVSAVTHDRATGTSDEASASVEDLKVDSSVFVWLDEAGAARKIVLFRLA